MHWLRTSGKLFSNRPDGFGILAGLVSLVVAFLILYPLGWVIYENFFVGWVPNTEPFYELMAEQGLGQLLLNTATVVSIATLLAVILGSGFAWLNERTDIGMKSLGNFLPVMPLLVPPIAGAIGWVVLAAPRAGFLNAWARKAVDYLGLEPIQGLFDIFSWSGILFVYVIYLLPHVYLTVAAGLRNLDPSLEEAARICGAGPWSVVMKVTIPAILPAVLSGGILALITGLALFSVPLIIGGQSNIEILSVRIVHLMTASYPPHTGVALLLGLVIVMVIGLFWWIQRRILSAGNFATIGGRGVRAARVRLGIFKWPARIFMIMYLLFASVLPVIGLIIVSLQPYWSSKISWDKLSFQNYTRLFGGHAFAREGLQNSVTLGIIGATVGMLIAAIIAFYIDRNRGRRVAFLVDATTKIPAAVSHLIIGIAFVSALAGAPFYLHGTTTILFLAYIVLYTPQATFTATSALAQVGRQLTEASLISGASQGVTFVRITLPLMIPGLMAGWAMLFVLMAGDITASSMLAGSRNPVAGFVILDLWTNGAFPPLAAFGIVISMLMSSVVLTSMWLLNRFT